MRKRFPLYVDAVLLVALLVALSPRMTGLPVHEWLGIGVIVVVIVHLLLSWSWISASSRKLVRRASRRDRVNYAINSLLFVLVVLVITSGIAISAVALPSMGVHTVNDRSWRYLHNRTLNFVVLTAGLHVAMNWGPLVTAIRRYLRPQQPVHEQS